MLWGLMSRWTMPAAVERVEPRGDLGDDPNELRDPERRRLRDAIAERAAGDVVDRQVVAPVRFGSLDDRDEMRVVHLGGGARFLAEPVLEDEIAGELDLEHLQRDLAAVLGPGPEDEPHPSLAERLLERVPAELVAGLELPPGAAGNRHAAKHTGARPRTPSR